MFLSKICDNIFIAQFRHLSPAAHYDSQVVNHETDPDTPLKSVDGHTFSKNRTIMKRKRFKKDNLKKGLSFFDCQFAKNVV